MISTYIHKGDSIDYTPAADVAAGTVVVQGDLVGIAKLDIPADTLGSLSVTGIYDVPKIGGPGMAITTGTKLYWDSANKYATTIEIEGKYMGKAVADAGDNDATVRVKLTA
jgi:predicted RecA/RadA family phage recombinase